MHNLDYVLYSISDQQIVQITCVHIHIVVQKVHAYPVSMVLLDNMKPNTHIHYNYKRSGNVFLCDASHFVIT